MSGLNLIPMLLPNPEASQLPEGQGPKEVEKEDSTFIYYTLFPKTDPYHSLTRKSMPLSALQPLAWKYLLKDE